jgi:hypothetical protein
VPYFQPLVVAEERTARAGHSSSPDTSGESRQGSPPPLRGRSDRGLRQQPAIRVGGEPGGGPGAIPSPPPPGIVPPSRDDADLPREGGGEALPSDLPGTPCPPLSVPPTEVPGVGNWSLSEDYAFCERARRCGFAITADTTIRLWHVGTYRYGWEDAGSTKERFGRYVFQIAPETPASVSSPPPTGP